MRLAALALLLLVACDRRERQCRTLMRFAAKPELTDGGLPGAVAELAHSAVLAVGKLGDLHQLFADTKASHAVVVDERGRALGLVSRAELCARAAEGQARTIAGVMSSGVVTVPATLTVAEASALMVRRGLQALVVTANRRCGALFPDDVVRFVASSGSRGRSS